MSGFEIAQLEKNQIVTLHLKGFLDAHTAPDLEAELEKCIQNKQYKVIVNFQELGYISSAGLGVFMGFIEEIRKNGGDIKLTNMSSKIFRVFDLLGFPALYEIFNTEEEAVQKFT
ncbi:MAG: STAS domain-containing protein [Deferribacteres bacterium]|nr:STAS domain-containing protein [candidate division KSB1 bacterium]MCB9503696.1 STAS domain-containing protein [Deferribacteres bacterium]